jgi:hypothetical protein
MMLGEIQIPRTAILVNKPKDLRINAVKGYTQQQYWLPDDLWEETFRYLSHNYWRALIELFRCGQDISYTCDTHQSLLYLNESLRKNHKLKQFQIYAEYKSSNVPGLSRRQYYIIPTWEIITLEVTRDCCQFIYGCTKDCAKSEATFRRLPQGYYNNFIPVRAFTNNIDINGICCDMIAILRTYNIPLKMENSVWVDT